MLYKAINIFTVTGQSIAFPAMNNNYSY